MRIVERLFLAVLAILVGPVSIVAADAEEPRSVFFMARADRATVTGSTLALAAGEWIYWVSDRPFRQSGVMPIPEFITVWSRGADAFADDPPNAFLTGEAGGQSAVAVIELTQPRLVDGDLVFDFTLLSGETVPELGDVSMFIDSFNDGGLR